MVEDMVVLQEGDGVQLQLHPQVLGIQQEHRLLERQLGELRQRQLEDGLRMQIRVLGVVKVEPCHHNKILQRLQLVGMLLARVNGVRVPPELLPTLSVFEKNLD